jgi:hypothetical protein
MNREITMTDVPGGSTRLSAAAAVLSFAALAGCAGYNPPGLSAMSAADLCELEYVQGRNLSPAARQSIHSELQRRNDNCRNHTAEVAQRYQAALEREIYGIDDP